MSEGGRTFIFLNRSVVAVSPGVCVVDGPHGGARRKLPVPLRHRHGRRPGDPVPRELGQLPAFPAAQRLPPFGL